jgi:hypothetical protein
MTDESEYEYEEDDQQEYFINKINDSKQNNYNNNIDHEIEILEKNDLDQQF